MFPKAARTSNWGKFALSSCSVQRRQRQPRLPASVCRSLDPTIRGLRNARHLPLCFECKASQLRYGIFRIGAAKLAKIFCCAVCRPHCHSFLVRIRGKFRHLFFEQRQCFSGQWPKVSVFRRFQRSQICASDKRERTEPPVGPVPIPDNSANEVSCDVQLYRRCLGHCLFLLLGTNAEATPYRSRKTSRPCFRRSWEYVLRVGKPILDSPSLTSFRRSGACDLSWLRRKQLRGVSHWLDQTRMHHTEAQHGQRPIRTCRCQACHNRQQRRPWPAID